jgi:hypothetical protein
LPDLEAAEEASVEAGHRMNAARGLLAWLLGEAAGAETGGAT